MSEAFSAVLGMTLGLVMGWHILQVIRPPEKVVVKLIICQKCSAQNPAENKFCGNCGQSLYSPPQITCQKCGSQTPTTMKFCGYCGSPLLK